ncbi:hypothetical protein E2C01_008134 [Portunus trituberculatus]|uniref:Uncharacterized protein n=1 Tax=Portunus trituberculatus TaxID=210409 RepID=A0A5B7D008_PORTR|nr:hypothetical protein [Portunus trituberculatus]
MPSNWKNQLMREKEHIWDPKTEFYSKKSLHKLVFNEIAATFQ